MQNAEKAGAGFRPDFIQAQVVSTRLHSDVSTVINHPYATTLPSVWQIIGLDVEFMTCHTTTMYG